MLIEILVSAMVLMIASAGVIMLLQTTTHSQAELRNNSEAYALAQEDQARLASMRLSTLNRLDQTRTITLNKTQFSVRSRGVFINDSTSKPSCGDGTASADYVEITSSVSWPGMDPGEKAKIVSVLSPSNGSLDPNNGTIAFSVLTQSQVPVPNVYISGGSGAFAGYSDAAGCAVFADVPAGNYTATVNGEAAGVVNHDGKYTQTEPVPAAGGDTKTVTFEFDRPGTIPVGFKYRVGSTGNYLESNQPAIVAYNSGMSAAKVFWTANGAPGPSVSATPLFPFSSTYFIYAGSCSAANPDPNGKGENPAAVANVKAPAGNTAAQATLQVPALEVIVKQGSTLLQGASVTVTDTTCKNAQGGSLKKSYTTNSSGQAVNAEGKTEPGLPWGTYNICASASISGTNRYEIASNVAVKNLAATTAKTIELTSGDSKGTC